MQHIAWALPTAYVYEGKQAAKFYSVFQRDRLWSVIGLNLAYLSGVLVVFLCAFRIARRRGLLLQSTD